MLRGSNIIKISCVLTILLIASSCATKIRNFENYQKHLLPKSQFLPTKDEMQQNLPKVLVYKLDENNIEVAKQSNLGLSISKNIENILANNNLAAIIDRSAGLKLKEEITLAQLNNNNSYKGPKITDYTIIGTISNASFSSSYKNQKSKYDKNSGTYKNTPAQFTYNAIVSGNIKILSVPSLDVIKIIHFTGEAIDTKDVQHSGGLKIGGISIGGSESKAKEQDDGLMRLAGEKALSNISEKLQNIFAKKGYILEKRIYKNKAIFKVNLGKDDGIREGDEFNIIAKYQIQNPITGEDEIENKIIATGKISNQINLTNSWIIIDNKKNINKIRLGDQLQIFYKQSFSKKHAKTFKTIGKAIQVSADIAEIYLENSSAK